VGTDERFEEQRQQYGGEGQDFTSNKFTDWVGQQIEEDPVGVISTALMLIPVGGWGIGLTAKIAGPILKKYGPKLGAKILQGLKATYSKPGLNTSKFGPVNPAVNRVFDPLRATFTTGAGIGAADMLLNSFGGEGSGTGDGEVQTAEGEGKVVQTPEEVVQTPEGEGKREIDMDALATFLLGMGGATSVAGALGGGGRAVQAERQRLAELAREESQFARTLKMEREKLTAASQRVFDQLAQSTTIAQQQMALDMLKVLQGSLPPPDYASAIKALQEKYADAPAMYISEMEKFTAEYIQRALRISTGLPSGRAADVDPDLEALLLQYDPDPPSV
jgi:hypothetical protein